MLAGSLRKVARRGVGSAVGVTLRRSDRQAGAALLYHGVGGQAGERRHELVPSVALDHFASQVGHLRRCYHVVVASELQDAAARRCRGRPFPVAITFDDDDAGYLEGALPVLADAGLRATFFLNGASLERPRWFWWERLQAAADRNLVDDALLAKLPSVAAAAAAAAAVPPAGDRLRAIGDAISKLPPTEVAQVQAVLADRLGADPPGPRMTSDDIGRLVDSGHEIGFHTSEHPFLPVLDDGELERSLREGREALEALAGAPLSTFAYPSGGSDGRVVEAARRAGYRAAFTTRKAPVTPRSDPLALGRIVPQPGGAAALSLELGRTLAGRPRPS